MITQSRLKQLLHYDPDAGVFTWIAKRQHVKVGDIAGSIMNRGYREISIDSKRYKAHRLAFLWMTGEFPADCTDHIDGDKLNNRWTNLRECTIAENHQNMASRKNSSSKYVGVGWHKAAQKWVAYISVNSKRKHLGCFDTEEVAYQAYCKAKAELYTFQPKPRENYDDECFSV